MQNSKLKNTIQYSSSSDEELVVLILKHDWNALHELFKRYQRPFFNLAYRFTGSPDDAEDLAEEILLRIYKYLKTFDQTVRFKPWAFKIATNTCLTFKVQKSKLKVFNFSLLHNPAKLNGEEEGSEEAIDFQDEKVDLVKEVQNNEISARVQKALQRLPSKYRLAVYLYFFEELKYEEIANDLDLPINTVRTHIKRGKEKMKEELRDLI